MNNGNIYTVTNLKDSTRTQTFTYDVLNRLATAQDAAHWSNVYTYDAWGNLTKKLYGPVAAGEHMDTSADSGNHLLGYSYDAGGNMTSDGVNTYVYDGENRVSSVAGVSYTYDADGRRVKKSSGTNYWYGPSGEALAETDSAGTWTNYIFFGGIRLARNVNGDIKYYITDHLHSTAVFADKSGTVLDDNDFYPWGGAVPGVGQTTSNNTIKFTGKYRDTESGLDYFGARYYANVMGRFMSPDWAAKPVTVPYAEFGDPQSLNLYAYARNTPIVRIDSDGHFNDPFGTFDTFAGAGSDFSNMSGSWFAPAGDNTNSSQQNQQQQQPQQQQQQQPQQQQQQQQQQPQQQPQNQQPASQPAPTGPDGKPTPPPVPVPGAPDLPWKWNPNPQNPRGGTWGPDGWKGPNPPNGSWDPLVSTFEFEEGIALLSELLLQAGEEDRRRIHYYMGLAYNYKKQQDRAISELEKVVSNNAHDQLAADAHYDLAMIYKSREAFGWAKKHLVAAEEMKGLLTVPLRGLYSALAYVCVGLNRHDEAGRYAQIAESLPDTPDADS